MRQILAIILLLIYSSISAQTVIKNINKADGLSHNSVRTIFQDKKGYLWFGTLNGITRYDGNNLRTYKMQSDDSLSISSKKIYALTEDIKGYIWSITFERNAHRIDPKTNEILNIKERYSKEIPAKANFSNIIYTKENTIYLCSDNAIFQFTPNSSKSEYNCIAITTKNILPNKQINFNHKDANDNLWIGTLNGVIMIPPKGYSPDKDNTKNFFRNQKKNFTSFLELEDCIWIADTKGNIYTIDKRTYTIHHLSKIKENETGPIFGMQINLNNDILIYTAGGLILTNKELSYIKTIPNTNTVSLQQKANKITPDKEGNFWITTTYRGITKYSPQTGEISYYDVDVEKRTVLGEPDKQILLEDKNGNIWLGLHGGGLNIYNKKLDKFEEFKINNTTRAYSSEKIILSLFEDNSQTLWVGYDYGGVTSISVKNNNFEMVQPFKNAESVFQNEVRAIETDRSGNIYVGTLNGKIKIISPKGDIIGIIPDDINLRNNDLKKINIYSLLVDSKDNLWIATKGEGIFVLENLIAHIKKQKNDYTKIVSFRKYSRNFPSLPSNQIYDLLEDNYGQIWFASYTDGIGIITSPFDSPTVTPVYFDNKPINSHEFRGARCLLQDKENNLWIGSSGGVSIIRNKDLLAPKDKFISFGKYNSEIHSEVFQIHQSSDNKIYLATMGEGLIEITDINANHDSIRTNTISSEDGLGTDIVFSITEDYASNLWLGTDLGLVKFDRQNRNIEAIASKEINAAPQFSENSALRTIDGHLIFGNKAGYVTFNPLGIKKDTIQFPVVLSNIYINGQTITPSKDGPLHKNIEFTQTLNLDHTQSSIRLEFSVLDYNSPGNIKYAYKLEGFDDNWSRQSTNNYAVYSKLPAGNYTFLLKGYNSDGIRNQSTIEMAINVKPPFWQSKTGIMLQLLVISTILLIIFSLLIRQIRLRSQIKIADDINERKIQYYTNISHEFKTPLSLIIGPIEDIMESSKELPSAINSKLHYIHKNSKYLLHLVEDILDFRRIREDRDNLNLTNGDIIRFFGEIYLVFKSAADRKGVQLNYIHSEESHTGYFDQKYLEKIAYNLLANAIRHTPIGKEINLIVEVDTNNKLTATVENYGKGIDLDIMPTIFERFAKNAESSGLGLFFVKELITQHKGEIEIENSPNEKAAFTITLSLSKDNYDSSLIKDTEAQTKFNLQSPEELGYHLDIDYKYNNDKQKHIYNNTILLIEDNVDLKKYLFESLSNKYDILTASNGKEGLEIAIKEQPDIIVCDVLMPIQDGFKTTELLKKELNTNHIPIILLTACDSDEQRIKGLEFGADDYITKPFNLSYLSSRIANLIEQRKKLKVKFETPSIETKQTNLNYVQDQYLLDALIKIVNENISDSSFNIDTLVTQIGVSRSVIYRRIKNITGFTPNDYLKQARIKKAAKMLLNSNKGITEISMVVGINDSNYFSKCFKQQYGVTPTAYRNKKI